VFNEEGNINFDQNPQHHTLMHNTLTINRYTIEAVYDNNYIVVSFKFILTLHFIIESFFVGIL